MRNKYILYSYMKIMLIRCYCVLWNYLDDRLQFNVDRYTKHIELRLRIPSIQKERTEQNNNNQPLLFYLLRYAFDFTICLNFCFRINYTSCRFKLIKILYWDFSILGMPVRCDSAFCWICTIFFTFDYFLFSAITSKPQVLWNHLKASTKN